jgi:hypothetical protein
MDVIKRIDIKEFREKGYLQEINRQFLHPLGLALEIIFDEDGVEHLGGIWDYREDPEGIYFSEEIVKLDRFSDSIEFIENEKKKRENERIKKFGSVIQTPGKKD